MRFARWIDVGDSNLKSADEIIQISLARVEGAKTDRAQPILYETMKKGTEFEMKISSQDLLFSEEEVLEICNKFYRRVLERDKSENIRSNFNILRLGQGSSAFATSLLILSDDLGLQYHKVNPPKTRKRIDDHFAMGWVELEENKTEENHK